MVRVLVVDDEKGVRESLRMLLKGECEVVTAGNVDEALKALSAARDDCLPFDLMLLDLVMPGRNGLDLLAELRERADAPPVVVLSATRTIDTAVEAMKLGAADYFTKPFEVKALRTRVRELIQRHTLEDEDARLADDRDTRSHLGDLIGASPPMHAVFRRIERLADSAANVLVLGESGTGKELVARAVHDLGPRSTSPFVAVNCAAIPEQLMESELFGHEKGAFTDARDRRIGRFELAGDGTLFLDEIGELSRPVQAKLLRALQERRIERVGGSQPIEVQARFISATHRDLEEDVKAGRFRADLYYRVHVIPIHLPALRDREGDVRILAEAFLSRVRKREAGGPQRFSRAAMKALLPYAWPGNVRELLNVVERAVALCESEVIDLDDLPENIVHASRSELLQEAVRSGSLGLDDATAAFEQQLLRETLDACDWNQTRAAERLGITRRSLKLKIDRHHLSQPPPR